MKEIKTIDHALSTKNGIVMYSNKYPIIGVRTYYNEDDEIKKEVTIGGSILDNIISGNNDIDYNNIIKTERILFTAFCFATIILSILFCNMSFFVALIGLFYSKTISDYALIGVEVRSYQKQRKDKNSIPRFHAAEHKVINAYEKKQNIPTFEEVEKASRFSKKCGTMAFFNNMIRSTCFAVFLIVLSISSASYNLSFWQILLVSFFAAFIFYTVFYFIKEFDLLRFMQILVTEKPTEREINLAIEAIKNFEELEKDLQEDGKCGGIEIVFDSGDF